MRVNALQSFLTGGRRNEWIKVGPIDAYVRKSQRWHNLKVFKCLDIASVSVKESMQRQGHFTKWYAEAVKLAVAHGLQGVYIESVTNPLLEGFCNRRGFHRVDQKGLPSFLKLLTEKETQDGHANLAHSF